MNIDLTEEQMMLRQSARDFLTSKCPGSLVRAMMEDEKGYPPDLWSELAGLGWLGLVIPTKYGGEGSSYLDLIVLMEEIGRASLPAPFFSTVVLGALSILHMGNEDQKSKYLPGLCKGEMIATAAIDEPGFPVDLPGITLSNNRSQDFTASGTKLFVMNAHIADLIVSVGRIKAKKDGDIAFLLNGKQQGLECNLLKTIDGSKPCELICNNVNISKDDILGKANECSTGIEKIRQLAAVAQCAEMLGAGRRILEMTIRYANERKQFGRLIGTYQSIQHHCANMAVDVDGMMLTTYQAAWMLNENLPCKKEVAIAKAWASEAFKRVCLLGLKVHGGMGFIEDHDISVFYRKAHTYESAFGNSDYHMDEISRELELF